MDRGNNKSRGDSLEQDRMGESSSYDLNKNLREFWPKQHAKIRQMETSSFREVNRHQELPLSRIKKIMKIEDEVKAQMISAEAPILLAKAAELLIEELTLRAWVHTQENRRKTIQKSDIATAVTRCEMFDFLIDIVPREEILKSRQSNHMEEGEEFFVENPADQHSSQQHQHPVQYIVQYNGEGEPSDLANSVMQLENGQIIEATQIGPSIPLSGGSAGQPIQLMTMSNANGEYQLMPVNSSS
uniref:Transcription factor CBF/NF-Y/archaeal histone domain-containing protein n=1 Tax=Ditylenchus dipsaci TaxID=166011 RepID=A0A915EP52_9BILA